VTEAERFAVVLDEPGSLLSRLDGPCEVVVIGGQVLAIEQVAASQDPVLQVETDTGQRVVRGHSFDPDLLIESVDPEESARWDELPHLLREAGYRRGGRAFQWEKQVGEVYVRPDLFTPEGGPLPPTELTPLPRGEAVLRRATEHRLHLATRDVRIRTPSIVDFLVLLPEQHLRDVTCRRCSSRWIQDQSGSGRLETGCPSSGNRSRSRASSWWSSGGSGQVRPASAILPRYSPTVLDDTPQLRAIARPDSPPCNFSLITSRSFRIGSLSAAITTSWLEAVWAADYPAASTLPMTGSKASHLAMRSAIGLLRNR